MKTRKEYLDGQATHREYYGQFVDDSIKNTVLARIGKERVIKSTNRSFNDIPLSLWDNLPGPAGINEKMKMAGDYFTLAGKVCIYKEAARQIRGV